MAGNQIAQGVNARRFGDAQHRFLRVQAENARQAGRAEAQDEQLRTAAEVGQAAAEFGASGGELNTGSSAEVLGDIAQMGDVDARRIQQNAENEAIALETQADFAKQKGKAAQLQGFVNAAGTVLTGGSMVSDKWNVFKVDNPGASFTDFMFGRTGTGGTGGTNFAFGGGG